MTNYRNIILLGFQISGNKENIGYLTEVAPGYAYENGKKTDNITHTKITVAFPDNDFEKFTIKLQTTTPPIAFGEVSPENPIKISLKNLTGKFYKTYSGDIAISATAEAMEVIA